MDAIRIERLSKTFNNGRRALDSVDLQVQAGEMVAASSDIGDMDAYERLLGAAMAGDNSLFAREDYVEEAWRIVDPVLKKGTPVYPYAQNTWGPAEVARVTPPGGWVDPVCAPAALSASS